MRQRRKGLSTKPSGTPRSVCKTMPFAIFPVPGTKGRDQRGRNRLACDGIEANARAIDDSRHVLSRGIRSVVFARIEDGSLSVVLMKPGRIRKSDTIIERESTSRLPGVLNVPIHNIAIDQ